MTRPSRAARRRCGRGGEHAIAVDDLGVRYDLRFTRKTTIRGSFGQMLGRGVDRAVLGAAPRLAPRGARRIARGHRAERRRQEHPAPGARGDHPAIRGRGRRPRATCPGLLTLGAGFDRDLSGRDNILLGGAFLGLDDAVTRELLPSIIEYAELGDFIDAPLKTYSSGMRARLGFAIATSVDPDILLLDEVLATGDAKFRTKSKARVIEIAKSAKAVVLVTHDMAWVTEYCNRAVLIERGALVLEGEPAEVVELHKRHSEEARARRIAAAEAAGVDPRIVKR